MSSTYLAYLAPVLSFAVYVGLGMILRGAKILGPKDAKTLNTVIVDITLPAFIFAAVYDSGFSTDAIGAVGVGWIVTLAMIPLSYLVCRVMKLDAKLTGSMMLCSVWANTGFMGYPLTTAIFGSSMLVESVFMDLFVSVLSLFTIGVAIAAHFGENDGKKVNPLLELVKLPQIWALVAAVICKQIVLPDQVISWITTLGNVSSPLIMISVGLAMGGKGFKKNLAPGAAACGLKLIVAPLIAALAASFLIGVQVSQQVAVLEMGCPTMMLCMVVAQRYGLDEEFVATIVFASVLLCVLTVPLMQVLLFH